MGLFLLCVKLIVKGEGHVMVQERGTALSARSCGDIAVVIGLTVEEVFGIEDEACLVLQELVADTGIEQETIGIHCI